MCNKKHTNKLCGDGRTLDILSKKSLVVGVHVYARAKCGCFLRVKVNGKPKTWKRQPMKVRIPYKYGIYEYGYLTEKDCIKVNW